MHNLLIMLFLISIKPNDMNKLRAIFAFFLIASPLIKGRAQSADHACLKQTNFTVMYNPLTAVVSDFNGDGNQDVVMVNGINSQGELSVFLAQSAGQFSAPKYIAKGDGMGGPMGIMMDDFDHDKNADILTLVYGTLGNYLHVFYGDGKGNFSKPDSFSTKSNYSMCFAGGDFNEDGHTDLAILENYVSIGGSNKIVVMYADANGRFTNAPVNLTGTTGYALYCNDLNEDTHEDLIVTGATQTDIYFGSGNGVFSNPSGYTTGTQQYNSLGLVIKDVNGDTKKDITVINRNGATLLVNNGNASFSTTKLSGCAGTCFAIEDFNGDGKLDLITAGVYKGAGINNGDGKGNFGTTYPFSTSMADFNSLVPADLNSDGFIDLVCTGGNQAYFLINSGKNPKQFDSVKIESYKNVTCKGKADGTATLIGYGSEKPYTYYWWYLYTNEKVTDLSPGTYTGFVTGANGCIGTASVTITEPPILELVLSNKINCGDDVSITAQTYGGTQPYKFKWSTNQPADTGSSVKIYKSGNYNLTVTDANGCSIMANQEMILNPRFAQEALYTTIPSPNNVAYADLDNDGFDDIITSSSSVNLISVNMGNGSGTFKSSVKYYAAKNLNSFVLVDIDKDGDLDVAGVSADASDTLYLLYGDGKGAFNSRKYIATNFNNSNKRIAVGDLNGDGFMDLVVVGYIQTDMCILINNGKNGFNINKVNDKLMHFDVCIGDVNNDSKNDILTTDAYDGTLSVMLGDGMGGISKTTRIMVGDAPTRIALGLLNNDKHLDVMLFGDMSPLKVYHGDGTGSFITPQTFNYLVNWVAYKDFNDDGINDLLLSKSGNNDVFIELSQSGGSGYSEVKIGNSDKNPGSVICSDFDKDGKWDFAVSRTNTAQMGVFLNCTSELSLKPIQAKDYNFDLIPNPAIDEVMLLVEQNFVGGIIKISDLQGRMLLMDQIEKPEMLIPLSKFNTGIYLVTIVGKDSQIISKRLMVK